ncbi:MAG: hypothetical protein CMB38_02185 [Euryarchaeota archaeon]|nr:hypothetical protein [Euryarchaeota archaeon]MBM73062.1 hypothetical protein [Euryarchaeota archaeon]DAC33424.1 MAG TPA: hypothetical protein D7I05_06290 [Candidatus Poseidoniales archaeon]|tara:strand:- start:608 stop:1051 length:444 start_codon:yes stop_codon:yes gene_type:complete
MAKKKSAVSLPDWATTLWQELGSPELDTHLSVASGDLFDRRHGLRRDDLVEVMLDVRAIPEGEDPWVRGRMMSRTPSSLEILTEDGRHIYLAREVVVRIDLVAHTRPAYIDDEELLRFERRDQKRRSSLHETAERKAEGKDDSHLWG